MIWNLLLIIPAALAVVGVRWQRRWNIEAAKVKADVAADRFRSFHRYDVSAPNPRIMWGWAGGVSVTWLVVSLVGMGISYNGAATLSRSHQLVVAKTAQRDTLVETVRNELSADQFVALMAATPDADLLLIVGNQASSVLVERARLLVQLNSDLYSLQNRLTSDAINLCAYVDNPITPRLFVTPDCPQAVQP